MRLKDEVVVVTGGGSGIGRAIAEACVREGARVAVVGRDRAKLESVRGAAAFVADVTVEADVERVAKEVVARFGQVDALVNNAGSAESAPLAKTDRALWERMFAANATSGFLMSRALLSELAKRKGRVVFVASIAGKTGAPYIAAYGASKHAALGLMRSMAAELAERGVRVNAVCPGYVDTPMTERSVSNIAARTGKGAAAVREMLVQANPQKRMIRPEEVAEVVVSLASRECAATGQAIDL